MLYRILFYIVAVTCFMTVTSCSGSKNKEMSKVEIEEMVNERSSVHLLNELYAASDADVETLSRMLDVTPSIIKRIRKGKTVPTERLDERIREVAVSYYENDKDFRKLKSEEDPAYGWYNSVLNFPRFHPVIFWVAIGLFILFIIIGASDDEMGGALSTGAASLILILLLALIAWIISLCCSPNPIFDIYTDSINTEMEQPAPVEKSNPTNVQPQQISEAPAVDSIITDTVQSVAVTPSDSVK